MGISGAGEEVATPRPGRPRNALSGCYSKRKIPLTVAGAGGNAMWIVVAGIAALVVIYWLVGMRKMARWNNDPRQQQLIQLLLSAGRTGDITDHIKVSNFLCTQRDWTLGEERKRLAHALMVVERITDRVSYERAKDTALDIGRAIKDGQRLGIR